MPDPTIPNSTPSRHKNSTNVRVIIGGLLIRGLIRAGFRLAPGLTAGYAARLFLAPQRRPTPGRSRSVSRETPLAVDGPLGPQAAWLYGRHENPAGPVILLVHGWEDDHLSWAPFIDRAVAAGYRVLAPDLPAHGRSPGRQTGIPVLAAGIAATAREAARLGLVGGAVPFHAVIAHSLGGTATLLAAAELGLAARRIAILAAPNHPRLFAAAMMTMLGLGKAQTEAVFRAIERRVGRSMDSLYLPPLLRRFGMPGLILHSRDDRVVPLAHSRENAAAWPGAGLRILDGLGHRRLVSDPQVHATLLHFIGSDAPADSFGAEAGAEAGAETTAAA